MVSLQQNDFTTFRSALDEALVMRKDRQKLVDRWDAEMVREWMAEGGFPSKVAHFLDGTNREANSRHRQCLKV